MADAVNVKYLSNTCLSYLAKTWAPVGLPRDFLKLFVDVVDDVTFAAVVVEVALVDTVAGAPLLVPEVDPFPPIGSHKVFIVNMV